ncbi:MAG: hypothetical protein KAG61_03100, partial [Bacteriovoracaceae bacterium]|nr:hypothetical protein [Bacteriovoracaceae bacterium]
LSLQGHIGDHDIITTDGDLTITSKETGAEWNDFSIVYNDSVTSGNERVEFSSSKQIIVYISAGVTTASQIKSLIDNDLVLQHLFDVAVTPVRDDYRQGLVVNTPLAGGVTNVKSTRDDVGFRCVAPIRQIQYEADSYHNYTYTYLNCENTLAGGPNGETKVLCQ